MRHERHTDGVVSGLRQLYALPLHFAAEEVVRHLQQHARAVAGLRVCACRAAMFEIAQHLKSALEDVVRSHTLDIGDKPHTAGFVLETRVVQPLLGQVGYVSLGHIRASRRLPFTL